MNGLVILRRARIALLLFLVLICITWAILFAIFLSHEWSHSSLFQKIFVVSSLSLYVFTAILLYLMAVRPLCPWWDVLRIFTVLVVHIGNSVLFTHYRPSFPCLGYDTETQCKEFIFIIFIGCWVYSVTTLCTAIALGVMAFIPRLVEPEATLEFLPLAGTKEGVLPSSPDWSKDGGSPTSERRTSPSPISTGLPVITYNNGGELPGKSNHHTSLVNGVHREIITLEPPHLWHGSQSKNSRPGNENRTRGGTISTRNAPGGSSIGSAPQHADSFSRKFLSYSPTSQVPIYSRSPTIGPALGGQNIPAAKIKPNRTTALPKPLHDASPPIALRTMARDYATENTPTVFPVLSNNPAPTSPWGDSPPAYPDHARTTTPNVYSFHPPPPNVLPIEVQQTPSTLLPPVPNPDVAHLQDHSAFLGPKDISSGNNVSFAASGSNAPLVRSVSQPRRAVQHPGVSTAHRASMPPVPEVPFWGEGNDRQVLDQTQWWGLVKSAATKP